jgi:hypothetical protein
MCQKSKSQYLAERRLCRSQSLLQSTSTSSAVPGQLLGTLLLHGRAADHQGCFVQHVCSSPAAADPYTSHSAVAERLLLLLLLFQLSCSLGMIGQVCTTRPCPTVDCFDSVEWITAAASYLSLQLLSTAQLSGLCLHACRWHGIMLHSSISIFCWTTA